MMHLPAAQRLVFAFTLVLPLLPVSFALGGETIEDKANGFTFVVPDGFEAAPDLLQTAPNLKHAYLMGDRTDDKLDVLFLIERLNGVIGRTPLTEKDFPPDFKGRHFQVDWQGWKVDAFSVPEQLGEIETVTYNIQIPLKRAAIQVKLFGTLDRNDELMELMDQILQNLKGESNWTASLDATSGQQANRNSGQPGSSPAGNREGGFSYLYLAVAIVIVVGGLVGLFFLSRITPKGTVLAISVIIYLLSWSFDSVRTREVLLLTGSLRMLGFAGGILGLVDLFRSRKKKVSPPPRPANPAPPGASQTPSSNPFRTE